MTPPNVPFCRTLQKGLSGDDVVAHKRAISRAFPDLYPWWKQGFSKVYGEQFADAVARAQIKMNFTATGKITKEFHDAVEKKRAENKPTEWAFDDYAIHLATKHCRIEQKTIRQKIVDAAFFWYGHRADIRYSQYRPMQLRRPPQVPDRWDCSGFLTNCHYAGGASDPNGRGYDGLGYTGTLMSTGRKCTFDEMQPGDAIFYGYSVERPGFPKGSPTHVALYVGKGMVLSLGSYPMGYYEYDYRRDINHYRRYNIPVR